jgi:hypothetical protein
MIYDLLSEHIYMPSLLLVGVRAEAFTADVTISTCPVPFTPSTFRLRYFYSTSQMIRSSGPQYLKMICGMSRLGSSLFNCSKYVKKKKLLTFPRLRS